MRLRLGFLPAADAPASGRTPFPAAPGGQVGQGQGQGSGGGASGWNLSLRKSGQFRGIGDAAVTGEEAATPWGAQLCAPDGCGGWRGRARETGPHAEPPREARAGPRAREPGPGQTPGRVLFSRSHRALGTVTLILRPPFPPQLCEHPGVRREGPFHRHPPSQLRRPGDDPRARLGGARVSPSLTARLGGVLITALPLEDN